ncbi:uncharacterized protein CIMG_05491 [Coccidioides immitis RS]|uniref:Regulatory P domain-containing protein n=1 Tax=Coccidioides immitis (strain RS) TaxID=246410 RepID=J3KFP7_COCIM|nr:uncharacterized protein CIMG_05491 [Coccidioides immitis RS]EAS34467.3 hypothetical protein CIMG_05491 [Coccidioides immitis RS]TPX21901.1 hypothetical protein DIZ76_015866 [Coccidioides immitis]
MKTITSLMLLASAGLASAANRAAMDRLMSMKLEAQDNMERDGLFEAGRYRASRQVKCVDGKAGEYSCNNVDLHGFLPHEDLGSQTRRGNDIWGWTSRDGREFGAVGQTDGTAFVEIMKDGSLEYRGRLPTQTSNIIWRDMKVIDGYVYIGAESPNHGLQVFDMRKLLNVTRPVTFDKTKDLTAWYRGFGSSHNVISHEEKKMIYVVGTPRNSPCKGGLYMLDVSNPAKPTSPGCAHQDGYVHDAQCVIYTGPDRQFRGREICFNYNEDTLTIMDVTNKRNPKIISKTPYVGAAYTHQGWLTDPVKMEYLLLDDELDESDKTGEAKNGHTTTYIFDIKSLKKPKHTGTYQSPVKSIDHNQYVVNGLTYQANYGSGLRIVDISSVERDPTGKSFKEVGFFDCHPEDDEQGGVVDFFGSWSVYPYFKSGYTLINSIERGVYSVKYTGPGRKYH